MYPGLDIFFSIAMRASFLNYYTAVTSFSIYFAGKKIVKNLLSSKSHAALLIKMKKVAPFKKSYNHDN